MGFDLMYEGDGPEELEPFSGSDVSLRRASDVSWLEC